MTATTSGLDPLDRIEKSIDIDAPASTVFALVSRPGWWINNGEVDAEADLRRDGDVWVVTHPEHGEFRFETIESTPPSYVAHRWHHRLPDDGVDRATLVEFRIEDRPGGGVRLSVVESGFSLLHKPREQWLADRADNDRGWDTELAAARDFVTAP
ncbi:Activator of Hsp90 ATPase homolog 1-like protein [Jatrophihabitans endophyticus]|uniref:Activator of Hsp90 ATPase homolog 1-like protein n=1 Tax=Jatrophihabitans endophyticus TaxID=1206085 RepID=A0A1M5QA88_9ACTN|nr:SRPBCC domain-containing protein [Jatrophihabitans endophyticus]SHH11067.1 Activator of Hsp90 ATPase homolog 1-like protein [Jatrophihabitans endophyticus]